MKKLIDLKQFKTINKLEQNKINGGKGSGAACTESGRCWIWVCDGKGGGEFVEITEPR